VAGMFAPVSAGEVVLWAPSAAPAADVAGGETASWGASSRDIPSIHMTEPSGITMEWRPAWLW